MPEWMDNSFWAFVALVIFVLGVGFLGVFGTINKVLDGRIKQIADELDEARRLREEATALLAEYEQKRAAAETEAADIVAAAQEEAVRMTAEAQASLNELVVRRTKAVEDKIAQAEAQAIADVRARSADLAIEAARVVLTEEMSHKGNILVDQAIADVGKRLN